MRRRLLAVVGGYALQVHPDKLLRRDHIVIDGLLNRSDCRFDQIEADRLAAMFSVHANADRDERRGSDQAAEAEHGTGSFHGPLLALHDSERITVGKVLDARRVRHTRRNGRAIAPG